MKPQVCVDFDGTIFDGRGVIPGCIEALTQLQQKYFIAIFSARRTDTEWKQMVSVLKQHSVPYDTVLPPKPEAEFYIDDKGVRFTSWAEVLKTVPL